MLESASNSDDDEMKNGDQKSTQLEPTIKHLMQETRNFRREAHNLVRRRHNIRAEISQIGMNTLKVTGGCSIYNAIKKIDK